MHSAAYVVDEQQYIRAPRGAKMAAVLLATLLYSMDHALSITALC